jgi:hypothetical protein
MGSTTFMSLVSVRSMLRRPRRRVAVLVTMFILLGAVVAHHEMPMDMHQMPAAVVCLAVLAGAELVVVAVGVGRVAVTPHRLLRWTLPAAPVQAPQSVPARAGPLMRRSVVLRR